MMSCFVFIELAKGEVFAGGIDCHYGSVPGFNRGYAL
jgi:hypothetical protein